MENTEQETVHAEAVRLIVHGAREAIDDFEHEQSSHDDPVAIAARGMVRLLEHSTLLAEAMGTLQAREADTMVSMDLVLERKDQDPSGQITPGIMITPRLSEDYWSYRVQLTEDQAIVGFPKFSTIGIGFAVEKADWNTNLPYTSPTDKIYNHIKHNAGYHPDLTRGNIMAAIALVQQAATEDRDQE